MPRLPSAQQGLLPWQCGVQVLERVLSEPQRSAGKCLHQTTHHPEECHCYQSLTGHSEFVVEPAKGRGRKN